MSHDPIDAVLDLIEADGGLAFTRGTNSFRGQPRGPNDKFPINSVFVGLQPGAPPQRFMGQVSEIRNPIISVRLRWSKFADGDSKSQAIQHSLHADSISGYLDLTTLQSAPTSLGEDSEGHHFWAISVSLVVEQTA